ncbi:MAG: GH3 auxin-responsive promoter family protein [Planctomycetota bacterium]|jgi:hypothetical protein
MSLRSAVLRFAVKRSADRFERASRDPVRTQTDKLLALVRKNAGTDYGKRYGFSGIASIEDWRERVPVVDYEAIRADVTRTFAGERNVLTAEDPVMYAQTSGTTGEPKYIPVTPSCRGQAHSDVQKTWLYHAETAHPGVFDKHIISLVSPAVEGRAPTGVPFGSTSGHIYKTMPRIVRSRYAIPYDVFEIADYQAKYYALMRFALAHDVGMIGTANPSSILKMCEKAQEFGEDIVRDIRDGTLGGRFDIDASLRSALESLVRPDPARAKFLEEARARGEGVLRPRFYWPNLILVGCWKGGTVGHYLAKLDDWIDPAVPKRDWGYLSSEARGSIPLSDEGSRGALTVAGNFFEFVDVAEVEAAPDDWANWNFLHVGEIEESGEYYIFVTTTGGLYRYDINDIVQVRGKYLENPQVVFLRKGRGMTNLTGEKVSVNQVITAHQRAGRDAGVIAAHFRVEADLEHSRYVFMSEFSGPTTSEEEVKFLWAVDARLKEINIEYEAKRKSMRLNDPILHVMKEGWYERGRRRQVEEGMRAFQAKTVLLAVVDPDRLPDQGEILRTHGAGRT